MASWTKLKSADKGKKIQMEKETTKNTTLKIHSHSTLNTKCQLN